MRTHAGKFLIPVVLSRRPGKGRPVKTAAEYCNLHPGHRFVAIKETAAAAYSDVLAIATSSDFCNKAGVEEGETWTAAVLMPDESTRLAADTNLYLHTAYDRGEDDGVAVAWRSVVIASTPELADWQAREAYQSAGRHFSETAVFPCEGQDVVYYGAAPYAENRAIFHKTYLSLIHASGAERECNRLARMRGEMAGSQSNATLLQMLEPEVRASLDDDPSREEILRALTVALSSDATASELTADGPEADLLCARWQKHTSQNYFRWASDSVLYCGFALVPPSVMDCTLRYNLLAGGQA